MFSPRLATLCLPLIAALANIAVVASRPAPARAESPPYICFAPLIALPAGDVPANWPLFVVTMSARSEPLDWSGVGMIRLSDGMSVAGITEEQTAWPLRGGFAPAADLVVGDEYDFRAPTCAGVPAVVTRYRVVEPIAEPTSLGTIDVSPLYAANPYRGAEVGYFVDVTLEPDAGVMVEPWASALEWQSEVDEGGGRTRASAPPISLAEPHSRLTIRCDAGRPVPATYVFRGTTTGDRRLTLATPEVSATIPACDTAVRVHHQTLAPLTPDEILFWDTAAPPPLERDSGCAIGGRHARGSVPWAMAMCLVVALWRPRRRR